MFTNKAIEVQATLAALDASQAIIEFATDGTILTANKNFLGAVGYTLEKFEGSITACSWLKTSREAQSIDNSGGAQSRAVPVRRISAYRKGRQGDLDPGNLQPRLLQRKPVKVVSSQRISRSASCRMPTMKASSRRSARLRPSSEFKLDGTILTADRTSSMPWATRSTSARAAPSDVRRRKGKKHPGLSAVLGSSRPRKIPGRRIQALGQGRPPDLDPGLLQPIFDYKGRPFKVVKYATDITKAVQDRLRKASIQQALDVDIGRITDAIANTNDQVASAASSSEETSTNVQAVATAAEELVASVKEIGRRVDEAAQISKRAVDQGNVTNQIVGGLADAAGRIGQVVELINSLASQTNLLALNATIRRRAG